MSSYTLSQFLDKENVSKAISAFVGDYGKNAYTGETPVKDRKFCFGREWESSTFCSRILKSGDRTIVFWADGTKTIVKRAEDEPDNEYSAFTAALGIKLYGSNSALKRMIHDKTDYQFPKAKPIRAKQIERTYFSLICDQDNERRNTMPATEDKTSCGGENGCCPIDFEAIERNLAKANTAKSAEQAGQAMKDALNAASNTIKEKAPKSANETIKELDDTIRSEDGLFSKMGFTDLF